MLVRFIVNGAVAEARPARKAKSRTGRRYLCNIFVTKRIGEIILNTLLDAGKNRKEPACDLAPYTTSVSLLGLLHP